MTGQDKSLISVEKNEVISIYKHMLRIRRVEEAFSERYSKEEMRCPMHLSIGQEAIAAAVSSHLKNTDHVFSNHRSHAHYLAKGGNLEKMVAELYGKETGCCGGRGGSMHMIDLDAGFIGATPIVGGTVPLAVGNAWSAQLKGIDRVTVIYFGDGCFEEGVLHESMNFASLHQLPVVFVCENNGYSVYTQLNERQPDRKISNIAKAHGLRTYYGDGNDVVEIYEFAQDAVDKARSGEGPQFIELLTHRWLEHCGPNCDDDLGYRFPGELLEWKQLCPIKKMKAQLIDQGFSTQQDLDLIDVDLQNEINDAFEFAINSAEANPVNMDKNIYA